MAELRRREVPVRAFVREPRKAEAMFGGDVELCVGNFGDAESLHVVMKGAERVFLASANHPRQVEYETHVMAAAAAGIARVVKLSALGATKGSRLAF